MELDLRKLIVILLEKWWIIVLSVILCSSVTFGIFRFMVDPVYTASTTLYVFNSEDRTSGSLTSSDLTVARSMVTTYVVLLKSDSVLSEVARQTNLGYTGAQIKDMISASSENNTEVIKVMVENTNPEHAQEIANTLLTVGTEKIVKVMKAGSVEVIDEAKLPIKPSSPNVLLNTVIGALLGLMISVMGILLVEMFDTTIKSEEDIKEMFNIPIVGVIPTIPVSASEKKGGKKHE
ncbi:MAG TPA: Wzz/FepE/Etk N-terminal domain-containing protein [Bacillota bacterium]|nr:Wzz/FepE/Etk N-terminal domain-containing protein [Bacillota bacterium]